MIIRLSGLSLLLILSFSVFGQRYLVDLKKYSVEDGFSSRTMFRPFQGKNGFIWVGTNNGLDRFDGIRVKHYSSEALGLIKNTHLNLGEDDAGRVWISTSKKSLNLRVVVFDPITETSNPYSVITGDAPFDIRTIMALETGKEHLFFGIKNGAVYGLKNDQFSFIFKAAHSEPIYKIYQAPSGHLWVFQSNKIYRLNQEFEVVSTIERNRLIPFDRIQSVYEDGAGNIHYTSLIRSDAKKYGKFREYGAYFINGNKVALGIDKLYDVFAVVPGTLERMVVTIKPDGTSDELLILNTNNRVVARQPVFYASSLTYFDRSGNLWSPMDAGLINITIRNTIFKNYLTDLSTAHNVRYGARGIMELDEKHLLVNGGGPTYKVNLTDGSFSVFGPSFTFNNDFTHELGLTQRLDFERDGKGNIWITDQIFRVLRYHPKSDAFTEITYSDTLLSSIQQTRKPLPNYPIIHYKLLASATLGTWIGHDDGLSWVDEKSGTLQLVTNTGAMQPLSGASVVDIYENAQGIWLATTRGMYLFDAENVAIRKHYHSKGTGINRLPHDDFAHIYEDAAGVFWLASRGGGVIRWHPGSGDYTQYSDTTGLSNNVAYAVYEDHANNLWIPTNFGINCMDKTTGTVQTYQMNDGIPHPEFNTLSHYRGSDSTLYFGGLNGITAFHPKNAAKLFDLKQDFPIVISRIMRRAKKDGELEDITQVFSKTKTITLDPDAISLEIDFSYLDFSTMGDQQYNYKIDGLDANWTALTTPSIRLNALPYGQYNLLIRARESNKQWSEYFTFPLHIVAPFYKTIWFAIVLALLGIACVWLLLKWRTHRLMGKQMKLEQEVHKRTEKITEQSHKLQEQANALKALDQAKSRFFANISHEFRTPLTLIIGPTKAQLGKKGNNAGLTSNLETVLSNANQLLDLINQLLDLAKSENGQLELELVRVEIKPFLFKQVQSFLSMAETKGIQLILQGVEDFDAVLDVQKIQRVFDNILYNALKFSPEQSEIIINAFEKEGNCVIEIIDQGAGIPADQRDNIFKRFYQLSHKDTTEGSGIGLALAKEYVLLHGGKIQVENNMPIGTKFSVVIPDASNRVGRNEPVAIWEGAALPKPPESTQPRAQASKIREKELSILIVEDHEGVRGFIKSSFDENYQVYEAADGQAGLQTAKEVIPDLIISDVMMPKTDGVSMTKQLKENMLTSHIPIILLTAKASLENKIEGLDTGADDYLTKPFESEELVARVNGLISNRTNLREIYSKALVTPEDKSTLPMIEQRFLNLAEQDIRQNLKMEDYDVQQLSKALKIERTTLYRKLKALTGLNPTLFIRTIRLKKGKELLESNQMTISEVAFAIGFSSSEYFSKMFKKQYGSSPSVVR